MVARDLGEVALCDCACVCVHGGLLLSLTERCPWAVGDPKVSSAPQGDPKVSSAPRWAVGDPTLNHPQPCPACSWQSPGRQSLLCLPSPSVPSPAVWARAVSAGARGRQSCQNAGMALLLLLWIPGRQGWQERGQGFTLQIHTRLSSSTQGQQNHYCGLGKSSSPC